MRPEPGDVLPESPRGALRERGGGLSRGRIALEGLAAVILTAALVSLGTGLRPRWPLVWFAPLPSLIVALRTSVGPTLAVAFLGWFAGSLNLWSYYERTLEMRLAAAVSAVASGALVFALAVVLFRSLVRRGAYVSGLVAFPALWVSCEYLVNLATGTYGSLAYSQLDFLPFLQLASLTGPWGLSFVLFLFPASIAIALYRRRMAPWRALAMLEATCGLVFIILAFGVLRLEGPERRQLVRVGLAASDVPGNVGVAEPGAPTARLLGDYATEVASLARGAAEVIVLPEKLGVVEENDGKTTDALFQSLTDETGAEVVLGVVESAPTAVRNEARIYSPGRPVASYDKHHMLRPFESKFAPGAALTVLRLPSGIFGVAICKDMDFTGLSRSYGSAGVGVMLVPAWDFKVDGWLHGRMAVMRGVESGFSIVRSAKGGYLTVSDTRGRVLAEKESERAPFATLTAEIAATHVGTLYLLLGDWFAWTAVALLAFAFARLVLLAKKPTRGGLSEPGGQKA
jgi:apolipoprotein N-acyltransferase